MPQTELFVQEGILSSPGVDDANADPAEVAAVRPLEPIWSLLAVGGSLFLVALYVSIVFSRGGTAFALVLSLGPLLLRGLAAIAGRIAPLRRDASLPQRP